MILLTLGKINRSEILDHLIGPAIVAVVAAIILIVRQQNHRNAYKRTDLAFRRGIVLPEPAPKRLWPWRRGLITSASLAAFYLLAFRGISFLDEFHKEYAGGAILMSFSFLFLGPFVAGFFTVDQAAAREPLPIKQWIIAPWIPILLNLALAIAVYWEGLICAIFIIPPAMILASLGGVTAGFIHRYRHKRSSSTTLLCMAVAPLLLCILETHLNQPLQTRTVDTSIVIHASIPTVWQNIERVRPIAPSELRRSWANAIGFPRPVAATLSHEGVGGVRNASFERGLNFTETITDWVPNQHIAFTIKADTAAIPRTTLDEHVTVGGRFFDVLTGEYDLHALPNGDTLLHLSSRERLSTDFNAYAAMWSDAVMRDMQSNILHVIRNRCESTQTQPQTSLSTNERRQ
jgi:hypothetical protein